MKNQYAPEDIIDTVKSLDTRATRLEPEQITNIINDGYTELCTIVQAFSNEEVVDLHPFYDNDERQVTLDIEEDVSEIYDLYLTIENQDKFSFDQGIKKIRDQKVIYRDNRYNGRVHLDFDLLKERADNAVLKYYYVPRSDTIQVYMDAQTWLAFKSALGVALYDTLHDVERNGQKRAEMLRRARAILPSMPEDATDPAYGHIFTGLGH
jgi:hypothetical protein